MKEKRGNLENNPEISIIIPVYNSENYLPECLNSIFRQTFTNFEVILVEDGSTDRSSLICDEYAQKDERVVCIHNKDNVGPVRARKIGVEKSRGKYIGFVDSDDWIEPDMFQKLYYAINSQDVKISMCARFEDGENESRLVYHGISPGKYDKKQLEDEVYPKMIVKNEFFEWGIFPGLWDKLFRKECVEQFIFSVPDEIRMGDDAVCTFPCILSVDSICILDECLYHYRQTQTSLVRRIENVETERKRYKTLYKYGIQKLCNGVYDLSEQWMKYCLFLMTPRADILYVDLDDNDYLFPFPEVKKGSEVVIYGVGLWGQRLFEWLKNNKFCTVVAMADQNYEKLRRGGFEVVSPDDIKCFKYDAIIVAASYAKTRHSIINELSSKYPNSQIYGLDEQEVFSEKTMKAFGLD